METITKKISIQNHIKYIEDMSLFGWEVIEAKKDNEYAYLTLQRSEDIPNLDAIKKLEKQWFSFSYPSMWPMILFSLIAFGLITALLIVWIVQKDDFNVWLWLLALGLPAFGFITLSSIYFGYRVSKMKNVINNVDRERLEIKEKLKTLMVEEKKDEN